jgi:hypothetical protein
MLVATAYYIEQCVVIALAIFMVAGSTWQLWLQSKNSKEIKPVQRIYMRALLVSGILEIIWSIDPRGIWQILSAVAIAFIKDYVLIILSFCGLFYLDVFCRVVFEALGRHWFLQISSWITCGLPLLATIIVQIVLTVIAININQQQPRNYFICFLVFIILLWTSGITYSLIYIFSIRRKAGLNFLNNPRQKETWMRLVKLTIFLWLVVIAAMYMAVYYVLYNRRLNVTLQDTQVVANPARYEFYSFLVLHISAAILVYLYGKMPSRGNMKSPAAVTPVASDVIIDNTKDKPTVQSVEEQEMTK